MFTNITWSTYFGYVASAAGIWYGFIALRFYPREIKAFVLRKFVKEPQLNQPSSGTVSAGTPPPETGETTEPDELIKRIEAISSRIEEAVKESSSKGYSKEEFIFLLQLTVKEFPELDNPQCRAAVSSLITSDCERSGFLQLGAEELAMLWGDMHR